MAGLDVYRPAAIEQLGTLAKSIQVDFFELGTDVSPVEVAKKAKETAIREGYDVLILDTAGRLQIDEKLMDELKNINSEIHPEEILLLVDAMAGQDAVNVANAFNAKLRLSGVIMSKLDGDAKGGAALSIKYITGLPIKFAGVGEKVSDLDIFTHREWPTVFLAWGMWSLWLKKPRKLWMRRKQLEMRKSFLLANLR